MDKLDKLRVAISDTDKQIAELFEKRMDVVAQIAHYKNEHDMPIYDRLREEDLLLRNSHYINNKNYLPYYTKFQKNMMEISKSYQEELLWGKDDDIH